jgi:hypothetical protein
VVAQEVVEEAAITETIVEAVAVDNKSAQFEGVISQTSSGTDASSTELADMIRRQRAAFDSADATSAASQKAAASLKSGKNACDTSLRDCVAKDCGTDFSKCAAEGDTAFGNRLNTCRRQTSCSGEEFNLFSIEIKADKEFNAKMASYEEVIECGNKYNICIFSTCGTDLSGCLGRAAETAAISKCNSIANECKTADNGLANRVQQVFGTLRQQAEVQIAKDEERLREIRTKMSNQCKSLGAAFDERSLDCVFTASFFAGDTSTLFASKKLYAGSTFDCTPAWFGVDITTYRENAARLTREATAASSAMLGAGLGIAAGAISSGAINRAMDTQKAEKAVKAAENAQSAGEQEKPQKDETPTTPPPSADKEPVTESGISEVLENYKAPVESSLNISDGEYGNTPFMVAIVTTKPSISVDEVEKLVAQGGDVNKTNNNGASVLHFAAFQGNMPVVKYFIEKAGAELTADTSGRKPSYYALVESWEPTPEFRSERAPLVEYLKSQENKI